MTYSITFCATGYWMAAGTHFMAWHLHTFRAEDTETSKLQHSQEQQQHEMSFSGNLFQPDPVRELCPMKLGAIICVLSPGCSAAAFPLECDSHTHPGHTHPAVPRPCVHFPWLALSTWIHTAPETSKEQIEN